MTRTVQSELLTVGEAAQELRCSVASVKRWLRDGQIAGVRTPGGHWRVPISELRALRVHADTSDRDRSADRRPVRMHG
jgi:excisionase family DNA binding protein